MKKLPRSKKVLEYALVSISALKSFLVGGVGAWVILMSTPGPFPLKGEMFLTCVADLGGTSGPDLELDNHIAQNAKNGSKAEVWIPVVETPNLLINILFFQIFSYAMHGS